jgi:hypothetical protein
MGPDPGGNVREDVGYEDDDFYSDGRTPIPRTWLPLDPNDDAAPAGPNAATSARRPLPAGSFTSGPKARRVV